MTRAVSATGIPAATGQASDVDQLPIAGVSPQHPAMLRVQHAHVSMTVRTPPEVCFDAFSVWTGYERWAPQVQGPGAGPGGTVGFGRVGHAGTASRLSRVGTGHPRRSIA
jgi:hypothetical protein